MNPRDVESADGEVSWSQEGTRHDEMTGDYLIGAVDFGGTKTIVAIASQSGRVLAQRRFETTQDDLRTGGSPADAATIAVESAVAVLRDLAGNAPLQSIGVVSPGIIDAGGIRLAPHVAGWEDLQLDRAFKSGFPDATIRVGNDVKAAACAEATSGRLRGVDPGLLVSIGTGVAVATMVGGRVVAGAHGWAGEVGYSPVHAVTGEQSSVEYLVGGAALGRIASDKGLASTAALIDSALADAALGREVAAVFDILGDSLATWSLVIDPERIVFTGGLLAARQLWWEPLATRLASVLPDAPVMAESEFGADAALYGAVWLATQDLARASVDVTTGRAGIDGGAAGIDLDGQYVTVT